MFEIVGVTSMSFPDRDNESKTVHGKMIYFLTDPDPTDPYPTTGKLAGSKFFRDGNAKIPNTIQCNAYYEWIFHFTGVKKDEKPRIVGFKPVKT